MIKIALAHESYLLLDTLVRLLSQQSTYHIIWIAENWEEVLIKLQTQSPDLLILDICLPKLGDLVELRKIIPTYRCNVLISTMDIELNAPKVFQAMGLGAVDVVSLKEEVLKNDAQKQQEFLSKVHRILQLQTQHSYEKVKRQEILSDDQMSATQLVAIGASTGGPLALSEVISSFPEDSKCSIVVIQHIDELFIPGLISWLNNYSNLPVVIAQSGVKPESGMVYVAGKNEHLVINAEQRFEYIKSKKDYAYAPSIDVFFESLSDEWPFPFAAVLLTGMGSDGAKGLKKLHEKKWFTIVQNKESCVIYGMPKAAIAMGNVHEILSLNEIGPRIMNFLGKST